MSSYKHNSLQAKFLEALQAGLTRKTLDKCSKWTEECRVMGTPYPGPWKFDHHPWLREMHDTDHVFCIGQKAAQMGYTECVLNRTFYKIDIRQVSALYILPAKNPDASDFSASRFDPALELSHHLEDLFSDVKNVGHKRAGGVSLYIRGSRSRSGLKSVPAGLLIFDEVDEMTQENIPLAFERQSGQVEKQTWMISTPTITDYGINKYFTKSDMRHYFFTCPHCSRLTQLTFPECLEITGDSPFDPNLVNTFLKCKECDHRLDHESKPEFLAGGEWVPEEGIKSAYRGYHINQLYSCTIEPWRLAESFLNAQTDGAHEQEFFNSKLGMPHIVKGARIDDEQLNACMGNHKNKTQAKEGTIVTMGIDVGRWLHYVINEYTYINDNHDVNMATTCRTIEIGKVGQFEELAEIVRRQRPISIVIDANPERRKAYEFAQQFFKHVWVCFYGNSVNGKLINKTKDQHGQELDYSVTVDRTSWLDASLGRIHNKSTSLPIQDEITSEYRAHMKALVKKPERDNNGNPTAKYINVADDHFAHANNYAEIALPLGAAMGSYRSISNPL